MVPLLHAVDLAVSISVSFNYSSSVKSTRKSVSALAYSISRPIPSSSFPAYEKNAKNCRQQ